MIYTLSHMIPYMWGPIFPFFAMDVEGEEVGHAVNKASRRKKTNKKRE